MRLFRSRSAVVVATLYWVLTGLGGLAFAVLASTAPAYLRITVGLFSILPFALAFRSHPRDRVESTLFTGAAAEDWSHAEVDGLANAEVANLAPTAAEPVPPRRTIAAHVDASRPPDKDR